MTSGRHLSHRSIRFRLSEQWGRERDTRQKKNIKLIHRLDSNKFVACRFVEMRSARSHELCMNSWHIPAGLVCLVPTSQSCASCVCVRFGGFGVINDAVGEFYKTGHWQTLTSLAHIIIDANFIFNFFFLRAAAAMFRRHKNKRLHFARIFVIIIWRTVAVHFTRTARRPCHVDIYVALIPRVNVKWQTMDSVCGACVCVCVCHQWRMDRAGLALAHVPLPLYAKAISDCRRINE